MKALVILPLLLIVLLGLLILLPFLPFIYYRDKKSNAAFQKDYKLYLDGIEGHRMFCYNSRANSKEFVEANILLMLPPEVNVIFLNGKTPESTYDAKYISAMLHTLKSKGGFPYLMKVSNGKLEHMSVNAQVYQMAYYKRDSPELLSMINGFYGQAHRADLSE